jgi:hypothetical protein
VRCVCEVKCYVLHHIHIHMHALQVLQQSWTAMKTDINGYQSQHAELEREVCVFECTRARTCVCVCVHCWLNAFLYTTHTHTAHFTLHTLLILHYTHRSEDWKCFEGTF